MFFICKTLKIFCVFHLQLKINNKTNASASMHVLTRIINMIYLSRFISYSSYSLTIMISLK